ncbi:MAG: MerR family transcriptional regulator [Erysipelothrix sp.]
MIPIANLLSISEFQKLVETTRETLLHYDEIGLFKPTMRAENGYRYYSVNQVQDFLYIKALRDMQLPLQSIAEIRNGKTDSLFELKNSIDGSIFALETTKAMIEAREFFSQLQSELPKRIFILDFPLPVINLIHKSYNDDEQMYEMLRSMEEETTASFKVLTWILGFSLNTTSNKQEVLIVEKINASPQMNYHSIYLIDGSYDEFEELVENYLYQFKNEFGFLPPSFKVLDINDNFQFGNHYKTTFMFLVDKH